MTPRKLLSHLETLIGLDGKPRPLRAELESALTLQFGASKLESAIRAESLVVPVARLIESKRRDCETRGVSPVLAILGYEADVVAGYCHTLPVEDPKLVVLKHQRKQASAILQAMRKLHFADFEKFGAKILQELGATSTRVTPHADDQGIDFFGNFNLGSQSSTPIPFLKLAHDVNIALAGQAKHYPNTALGPDVVRELIGAVSLARTRTFSKPELSTFADLLLKPFSPLVTLLFTTGEISKGARELAEGAGLIARSGDQLAAFLADRGVGLVHTPEAKFDADAFTMWVNS